VDTATNKNIFSLANCPPWAVAGQDFQDNPCDLHIGRVRDENRRFFTLLDATPELARRGEIFHEYLSVQFALHQWQDHQHSARSCLRNSYVRFLRGWAVDSNSIEGAVLKGWVHSRIGIPPTFHGESLTTPESFEGYAIDRLKGCSRTNAIESQLDLLFEFSQYELARRHPGERWLTLYRGTFDGDSYDKPTIAGSNQPIVRMNNISSFTSDRECAWEFGSTVWEVRVPLTKIFFFSDLLPESILRGEQEFLVIGGEYRVRKLLY
jgi:NAD+--dinitrogen-reductase ADP-D-ribosyltransferase